MPTTGSTFCSSPPLLHPDHLRRYMGTCWSKRSCRKVITHSYGHRPACTVPLDQAEGTWHCFRSAEMQLPTPKERLSLTCASSAVAMSLSIPLGSNRDALLEPMGGEVGAELFRGGGESWDKPWKNRGSALCVGICAREEAASLIPARLFPLGTQEGSASPCPTKLSFFHPLGSRSTVRITREETAPGSSSGLPTPSRGAAPGSGTGPPSRCSLHWSQ